MKVLATLNLLGLFALGLGVLYLIKQNFKIMANLEEFQQALADINEAATNIADDITRLTDQLGGGGLTVEQETQILTELRATADRLRAIADVTPEEEPPVEEPPTE